MGITIKTENEISLMREAGRILNLVHEEMIKHIKPGMSTWEVDKIGHECILSHGCKPSFLNYEGYPASICVSVNDEVVHGIPSKKRILKDGDIVSLDAGVIYKGWQSDAARTVAVGTINAEAQKLIDVTKQSFFEGIKFAREGYRISDIGHAVQEYVEANGFSVVREYVGHGVGRQMHEAPEVPNYGAPGHGPKLLRGMTIAVEPMVNAGTADIRQMPDGWTVRTADGKYAAHYENTVLITSGEPELLTVPAP